jgi:hypothetical protein
MILAYYSTRLRRILAKGMMLQKATRRRRKKKRIRKSTFHEVLNYQGGSGAKAPTGA